MSSSSGVLVPVYLPASGIGGLGLLYLFHLLMAEITVAMALMAGCRVLNLAREETEALITAQEISFLLSSGGGLVNSVLVGHSECGLFIQSMPF